MGYSRRHTHSSRHWVKSRRVTERSDCRNSPGNRRPRKRHPILPFLGQTTGQPSCTVAPPARSGKTAPVTPACVPVSAVDTSSWERDPAPCGLLHPTALRGKPVFLPHSLYSADLCIRPLPDGHEHAQRQLTCPSSISRGRPGLSCSELLVLRMERL